MSDKQERIIVKAVKDPCKGCSSADCQYLDGTFPIACPEKKDSLKDSIAKNKAIEAMARAIMANWESMGMLTDSLEAEILAEAALVALLEMADKE